VRHNQDFMEMLPFPQWCHPAQVRAFYSEGSKTVQRITQEYKLLFNLLSSSCSQVGRD
jgi:hypothetical protein